MIEIRTIDRAHRQDIDLPNEPFPLRGRMIPSYQDETWSHTVQLFPPEEAGEMCFPDEVHDYDGTIRDHVYLGAYDGETCVGLAILADAWFKYLYLDDLKVCGAYRGRGIGRALIQAALETARGRGYRGLYTIGQDDNLNVCEFYLKTGFEIGGFDSRVYRGTAQESRSDIIFYLDG